MKKFDVECRHFEFMHTFNTVVNFSIQVHVVDVDDNPPVFTNKIFTGGISTDVSYGSVFMQVFV